MENTEYKRLQELAGIVKEMASESHITEFHKNAMEEIKANLRSLTQKRMGINEVSHEINNIIRYYLVSALDRGYIEGFKDGKGVI
jgi:predicted ATP-dependent protease